MKETIERIQDWYKLNCNGDWEHSYGYSISTLDNPGWTIRIDLADTCLEKLDFYETYQNPEYDHDWYIIKTGHEVLEISCGPENLKQVLEIFLDKIIPIHSNKDNYYDVYLPLQGHHFDIWTPAKATIVNEEILRLIDIQNIEYKNIKVRDISKIDFGQPDLENLELNFKIGDELKVTLENIDNSLILTTKKAS
jgi:hypothetical protein